MVRGVLKQATAAEVQRQHVVDILASGCSYRLRALDPVVAGRPGRVYDGARGAAGGRLGAMAAAF